MSIYVNYSGATDKTGMAIAQELKAEHGIALPTKKYDIYIGWGSKTDKDVKVNATFILNHPNNIRKNRNKFDALKLLKTANVSVGNFEDAQSIINKLKDGTITLPVIGRTNFHQGGKNFWLCLSKTHVLAAIKEGAQYFQSYVPFTTEYRMHVVDGTVFYAGKKEKHDNPQQVFVDEFVEKTKALAEKAKVPYDVETAKYVLNNYAERKQHSNPILKSHSEGWKFSKVETKELSTKEVKALCEEAVKAVKAIGLTFGAVDCALDEDNKPFIIEVNSGPGLTGTSFEKWIEMLKNLITKYEPVKKNEEAVATKPAPTPTNNTTKNKVVPKEKVISQLEYIQELLKHSTNNEEAKAVMAVAARVLNSVEATAGADFFG